MADLDDLLDAFARQERACAALGSTMYAAILRGLAEDTAAGGITWTLLHERQERPVHDALPLRLLGALHRIALRGDAPALAARYPSAGGDGSPVPVGDVLDTIRAHVAEVRRELGTTVQTNEVARCAVLATGFTHLARRWALPLRLLEVGASAGLNLNWDRYWYDTGASTYGDPASPLRFDAGTEPAPWGEPIDLSGGAVVASRRGCDVAPLDPTEPDDRLRLLSFVWPDQLARFARLRAALDIALAHPPQIDRADAGDWLTARLAEPVEGVATVVYHSIVWQYLGRESRDVLRVALRDAGDAATERRPLAWMRMEPAGPVTDLRVTTWPGGDEVTVAHAGYHGQGVRSGPPTT